MALYELSKREVMTEKLLEAKFNQKLNWEVIGEKLDCSPVWIASVCLGQNAMDTLERGRKLGLLLGFTNEAEREKIANTLMTPSLKGQYSFDLLRQDPCIARLHEVNLVYGMATRELILEKFGPGIMSAIDFSLDIDKVEDKKGDRVKITMCGKFLPFKQF